MAVQLNVQRILFGPFGAKPLSLRRLADGAVSLLSVLHIKWMAHFTVCFSSVQRRYRNTVPQCVLFASEQLKMLNIHTSWALTNVINHKPIRNIAVKEVPRNAMGAPISATKMKRAVTILVDLGLPHVALTRLFPFCVESLFIGHRHLPMGRRGSWYARGNL